MYKNNIKVHLKKMYQTHSIVQAGRPSVGTLQYTTAGCYYGYFGYEGLGWQLRFLRKLQTD